MLGLVQEDTPRLRHPRDCSAQALRVGIRESDVEAPTKPHYLGRGVADPAAIVEQRALDHSIDNQLRDLLVVWARSLLVRDGRVRMPDHVVQWPGLRAHGLTL